MGLNSRRLLRKKSVVTDVFNNDHTPDPLLKQPHLFQVRRYELNPIIHPLLIRLCLESVCLYQVLLDFRLVWAFQVLFSKRHCILLQTLLYFYIHYREQCALNGTAHRHYLGSDNSFRVTFRLYDNYSTL